MINNSNDVKELTIEDLFNGTDHYLIPPYQRNYAWREPEIGQLIQDIIDQSKSSAEKNYYIGTLVTYRRSDCKYEVIDGQQRLTTLSLLMIVLHHDRDKKYQDALTKCSLKNNQKLILEFASRRKSTDTLLALSSNSESNTKCGLKSGYDICERVLSQRLKDSVIEIEAFVKFLLKNVNIIRVIVPKDTDLNHYFEIMNNRGEQLEKHEILKARFMEKLTCTRDKSTFAKIWDACANMDRYLQYEFSVKGPNNERNKIFGDDWSRLACTDFDQVKHALSESENTTAGTKFTINNIITKNDSKNSTNSDKDNLASERFSSVVNFPNFLLHALRIFVKTSSSTEDGDAKLMSEIPLDDKRLLDSFDVVFFKSTVLDIHNLQNFVKNFAHTLLRCKFLFDKYIIKREVKDSGVDGWELKSLMNISSSARYNNTFSEKNNETSEDDSPEQRNIILLLSMFHVSAPAMLYKYWLNGALYYLLTNSKNCNDINPTDYKDYLQSLARKFVFGRYLTYNPDNYDNMIYQTTADRPHFNEKVSDDLLQYDNIKNNLVFNYLDYLLCTSGDENILNICPGNEVSLDEKYEIKNYQEVKKKFIFTFRSSVEHYYSQKPNEETGEKVIDEKLLHCFGNLCLIAHEQNSSLNNNGTKSKKDRYNKKHLTDKKPDSMKQYLMMSYSKWDKDSITDHHEKMINILKSDLMIPHDE
ncbi:MAG TPA: DUF262 domain-containing HNH endonuclease family protein [Burkholderiales bacterium]|nr:DUF262 domain-containing HNH endonuclease family protein [Burkholderiales bacterium]